MTNLNVNESKVTRVSELRKGAKNEVEKFFSKPTEVFRALREVARDKNSALYAICLELEIKPNKIGFSSFGKYAIEVCCKVRIHAPKRVEIAPGLKRTILVPCDNKVSDYIRVLCLLLSDKRKEEKRKAREEFKAQKEAERAYNQSLSKEQKNALKKEKERSKLIDKLLANGKSKEESEFLAALLVA